MSALVHEKVWVDKNVYNDAERAYYESLSKVSKIKTFNYFFDTLVLFFCETKCKKCFIKKILLYFLLETGNRHS